VLVEVPHPQDDGRDVVVEYRFFPLEGGTVGAIGRRRAPDEALQDQLGRAKAELQQKSRMLDEIQMELTQVPFTDPVTGVWNRLQVIERLTMEWSRTERWGSPLACMLVEVDRIGDLRRRLGDGTADELLRVVARRLKSVVRDHDIVGRYGGATFVVIAVHCDAEGAKLLARRMAEGVRQEPAVVGGRSIPVGLRIGASTNRSGDVEILEDLFSVAERALADARRQAVDFLCASESAS
jgi:diguanylate cyclase (GGDEF)-like protein